LWHKGVAAIASGLFLLTLLVIGELEGDPLFAAWYESLSKPTLSSATIAVNKAIVAPFQPEGSQVPDLGTGRPLTPDELNGTGLAYLTGQVPGQNMDPKQMVLSAAYYFTQAAEAGSVKAQFNLGMLSTASWGDIGPDDVYAMKWLLIAKANGASDIDRHLKPILAHSTATQIAEANGMAKEWLAAHH